VPLPKQRPAWLQARPLQRARLLANTQMQRVLVVPMPAHAYTQPWNCSPDGQWDAQEPGRFLEFFHPKEYAHHVAQYLTAWASRQAEDDPNALLVKQPLPPRPLVVEPDPRRRPISEWELVDHRIWQLGPVVGAEPPLPADVRAEYEAWRAAIRAAHPVTDGRSIRYQLRDRTMLCGGVRLRFVIGLAKRCPPLWTPTTPHPFAHLPREV
jgi:hypothetical protein